MQIVDFLIDKIAIINITQKCLVIALERRYLWMMF